MAYTERRFSPGLAASAVAIVLGVVMIAVLLNFRNSGPSIIVFFLFLVVAAGLLIWSTLGRRSRATTGELTERPAGLDRSATVVNIDEVARPVEPPAAAASHEARLRELQSLRSQGLLTAEEYEAKRHDLLSKW